MMTHWKDRRQQLLEMSRKAYDEALFAGTSGNLSMYDREEGLMLITPSSVPYETMKTEDLVLMKLDGEVVEGENRPSSEWRMHAAVYRNKDEVSAVLHTHSPYATSFAVNKQEIPVILIEMVPFLGGSVPVAEFALPGTDAVGEAAVKALCERNACLMTNHGVLAVGATLEQAHIRAVYVEDAAKIYSLALSNGKTFEVPEESVRIMQNRSKK